MNKSEVITGRLKNLIGTNEDIGYSGVTNNHFHIYQLSNDGQGGGRTIGTKTIDTEGNEADSLDAHVHRILDFEMVTTNNHSHSLS